MCEMSFLHRLLSTLMGMDLGESIPLAQSPAPAAVLWETQTMDLPLHLFPTQSVGLQRSQTKINGRNFHSTLAMASIAVYLPPPHLTANRPLPVAALPPVLCPLLTLPQACIRTFL